MINEVFIEGFHALYKVQIGKLHTQTLFNTGISINAILFKFYSTIQQQLKILPTSRKVVSADSDSLGAIGEVHLKFRIGKVVLGNVFIILYNLQCDIIMELVALGIKKLSILLPLKTNSQLLVLSHLCQGS